VIVRNACVKNVAVPLCAAAGIAHPLHWACKLRLLNLAP
jgi:hypothetical protein